MKEFTEKQWLILRKKFRMGKITERQLVNKTETQSEHPEWWDDACLCDLCKSYC